jgi:hypothetical protein
MKRGKVENNEEESQKARNNALVRSYKIQNIVRISSEYLILFSRPCGICAKNEEVSTKCKRLYIFISSGTTHQKSMFVEKERITLNEFRFVEKLPLLSPSIYDFFSCFFIAKAHTYTLN